MKSLPSLTNRNKSTEPGSLLNEVNYVPRRVSAILWGAQTDHVALATETCRAVIRTNRADT